MLVKVGKTYYNGEERPVYLLQGNATQDGEDAPINGKDHGKVSVAAVTNPDGSTVYVTVNGWRNRAIEVSAVRKLDSVLAVGVLKKRTWKEKDYWDLDADFLCISGAGISFRSPSAHMGRPYSPDVSADDFEELPDATDDLPF